MTSTAPLHVGSVHGVRQALVTVPAIAGARRPPPLRDSEAGTNHCPSCPMGHHHWGPTSGHWPLPRHVRSVHGPQHLHTLYQGYDGQHTPGNGQQASKLKKEPARCNKDPVQPNKQTFFKEFYRQASSVQSLSRVQLFATPWTAPHQASLSITNSQSLRKLISIESVIPSKS